ncbi:MAG: SIMPL domain-containing protein [Comamonas sp.]|jgi:predicted secreted protein|uniref:SIMPL domain-containing protein n=1 Tax=Comamonas sp. TaxID=34028 RepID=UPI002817C0F6|nr:SIMPL domain-containing protein [Comamonas sp.]MDR0213818.1 SIMPL domain-containing protein [Comamonas sp.]MDR2297241.1 SIMPL domain-containing protein [Comamonas sp.]
MTLYSKPQSLSRTVTAGLLLAAATGSQAWAQSAGHNAQVPMNVVQLAAQGVVEVKQDWMTATLSATKDGRDAATVQSQLQKAVEAAMTTLRADARAGQMEVSTGNFSISPRYGNNGKVEGWQGQADIVLQGRDFVRITQSAAKVQDMTLSGTSFGLSREAREKVEGEAQAKAIENFRQRAAAISKSFGFAGYSVREVSVHASGGNVRPMLQARAASMSMAKSAGYADAAPVPVESDSAEVTVNVSGSVQMQ